MISSAMRTHERRYRLGYRRLMLLVAAMMIGAIEDRSEVARVMQGPEAFELMYQPSRNRRSPRAAARACLSQPRVKKFGSSSRVRSSKVSVYGRHSSSP